METLRNVMHSVWRLLFETTKAWLNDNAMRQAAGLAFYSIFSMAPLLLIAIGVAGIVFEEAAVQGLIVGEIEDVVGFEAAIFIEDMLLKMREQQSNATAALVGLATVFIGAIAVFNALQDALNTIWGVQKDPKQSIWYTVRRRSLAFVMILLCGLMLLVSFALGATLATLQVYFQDLIATPWYLWQGLDVLVWFGFFMILFAAIYKFLPDVKIAWKDVWVGAGITSLLFSLGKFAISMYLARSGVGSIFGAAGSFVVILMWTYYSWAIVLFGAELTKVYSGKFGKGIVPGRKRVAGEVGRGETG